MLVSRDHKILNPEYRDSETSPGLQFLVRTGTTMKKILRHEDTWLLHVKLCRVEQSHRGTAMAAERRGQRAEIIAYV